MKVRKRLRIVVASVFLIGLAAVGVWASRITSTLAPGKSFLEAVTAVKDTYFDPGSQFPGQTSFTVLLVGRDYNRDRKGMAYTKASRADTIMMLKCDLEKHTVTGLSVPRDTKVRAKDGITGKINATLGRGGIDLLRDTVEDLIGVRPDYTVLIKADAVREIVNVVGGVEVETIDEMHYDDDWGQLHIHLPKGVQRINGEQAVGFTRFREVNVKKRDENGRLRSIKVVHSKEEGDARRMARQQQLIRAIAAAGKAPSNWARIDSIIDTSFNQLDTNFTRLQLMAMAQIFKDSGEGNIKTATLMGGEENGEAGYFFIPDERKTTALVEWLFHDNEVAARQMVRVAVYNGTKVKGAAKVAASNLEEEMYDAFSGGNSKDPCEVSSVVFRTAAVADKAKHMAELLGIADVHKAGPDDFRPEVLGAHEPDVYVTIGSDRADQIVASKAPDTESRRVRG